MKIKRIAAILMAVSLLLISGCRANESAGDIAVIVKATDSDFWGRVKSGVDSAATEYNVNVTFQGPSGEEDYIGQNQLIYQAIDAHVGAVVLSAIDYEKNVAAAESAVQNGIKLIVIDSDVDTDKKSAFIGTDNYDAGKKAAVAAAQCVEGTDKINIGIVNFNESTQNGQQRQNGFTDYINKVKNAAVTAVVNTDSNTTSATAGAIKLLRDHPEINVLVGFNEWTTLGVGYAISQTGLSGSVYGIGFDSNTVSVSMLETGEMDALVVQNPFSIGYLGVTGAVSLMSGKKIDKKISTDIQTVTKANMFDADIQRFLFPFK